jgi:hypothetical protein
MGQVIFLLTLFPGVGCLIAGMMWTRLHWRPDVPPYTSGTRFWDVTLHPERYASADAVLLIRSLNTAGVCLLAVAVAAVAYELFNSRS